MTFRKIGDPGIFIPNRAHNSDQTTMDFLSSILYAFATLFIILDPLISVPIFATMTKGQTAVEIHKQAFIAVAVAGSLIYLFLIFNTTIFAILGLRPAKFPDRGGIPALPPGPPDGTRNRDRSLQGACQDRRRCGHRDTTPLRTGTITTVMLLSKDYGILIPFIAITLSLIATWIVLYYSELDQHVPGEVVTDIMGKVLGMLVEQLP